MTFNEVLNSKKTFDASGITNPHEWFWGDQNCDGIYWPVRKLTELEAAGLLQSIMPELTIEKKNGSSSQKKEYGIYVGTSANNRHCIMMQSNKIYFFSGKTEIAKTTKDWIYYDDDKQAVCFPNTDSQMIDAFKAYQKAHLQLLESWNAYDHTGGIFTADYPFELSFDELFTSVKDWCEKSINDIKNDKQ